MYIDMWFITSFLFAILACSSGEITTWQYRAVDNCTAGVMIRDCLYRESLSKHAGVWAVQGRWNGTVVCAVDYQVRHFPEHELVIARGVLKRCWNCLDTVQVPRGTVHFAGTGGMIEVAGSWYKPGTIHTIDVKYPVTIKQYTEMSNPESGNGFQEGRWLGAWYKVDGDKNSSQADHVKPVPRVTLHVTIPHATVPRGIVTHRCNVRSSRYPW